MRKLIPLITLFAAIPLITGCQTLQALSGAWSQYGQSAMKIGKSAVKSFETMTPEQEYYLGRAVTATILKEYKPYNNKDLNRYLNLIGRSLADVSDKPETFSGYHFLAIDSDEVNAFAAPSGFILVSRGLIRCCGNEDELAAVLAHEVAHIQCAHGVKAIKKSRWTDTLTTAGMEAAKTLGPDQLADLTTALEGSITDITGTLVNSGYSTSAEYEADKTAVVLMKRLGYSPAALVTMLKEIDRRVKTKAGFGKTHPSPVDRIGKIGSIPQDKAAVAGQSDRATRFMKATSGI